MAQINCSRGFIISRSSAHNNSRKDAEVRKIGFLIDIFCIFAIGCSFGWLLEVIFRRFWSGNNAEHRWVNPGFLKGPWLPVYGLGLSALYTFCRVLFPLMPTGAIFSLLGLCTLAVSLTLIEYIAGVISKRVLHATLWDYSGEKGNVEGIICPLFSLFWAVLGAVYYFFVHSPLDRLVRFLSSNPLFLIAVGIYAGVFFTDVLFSVKQSTAFHKNKAL